MMRSVKKNKNTKNAAGRLRGTALSLALAAAVAAASAGCSNSAHSSSAPEDPTETVVAETASAAETVAAETETAPAENTSTAAAAAEADTTGAAEEAGSTAATASETAAADPGEAGTAATEETAAVPAEEADGEEPFADDSGTTAGDSTSAAADIEEADIEEAPARDTEDTALLESVLSEALVECTGWGQSAGSSLRAASAATRLLRWANQVQAGSADAGALKTAVEGEFDRLSSDQRDMIRNNWPQVSFNAETILDDIEELQNALDDAGCLKAAQDAAANENAKSNWKAASGAIEEMLR